MLTLGANLLDKSDTRVALETETNSNNLVISLAEVKDEGEYICQVSAYNPIEIKHTVQIRGTQIHVKYVNYLFYCIVSLEIRYAEL